MSAQQKRKHAGSSSTVGQAHHDHQASVAHTVSIQPASASGDDRDPASSTTQQDPSTSTTAFNLAPATSSGDSHVTMSTGAAASSMAAGAAPSLRAPLGAASGAVVASMGVPAASALSQQAGAGQPQPQMAHMPIVSSSADQATSSVGAGAGAAVTPKRRKVGAAVSHAATISSPNRQGTGGAEPEFKDVYDALELAIRKGVIAPGGTLKKYWCNIKVHVTEILTQRVDQSNQVVELDLVMLSCEQKVLKQGAHDDVDESADASAHPGAPVQTVQDILASRIRSGAAAAATGASSSGELDSSLRLCRAKVVQETDAQMDERIMKDTLNRTRMRGVLVSATPASAAPAANAATRTGAQSAAGETAVSASFVPAAYDAFATPTGTIPRNDEDRRYVCKHGHRNLSFKYTWFVSLMVASGPPSGAASNLAAAATTAAAASTPTPMDFVSDPSSSSSSAAAAAPAAVGQVPAAAEISLKATLWEDAGQLVFGRSGEQFAELVDQVGREQACQQLAESVAGKTFPLRACIGIETVDDKSRHKRKDTVEITLYKIDENFRFGNQVGRGRNLHF